MIKEKLDLIHGYLEEVPQIVKIARVWEHPFEIARYPAVILVPVDEEYEERVSGATEIQVMMRFNIYIIVENKTDQLMVELHALDDLITQKLYEKVIEECPVQLLELEYLDYGTPFSPIGYEATILPPFASVRQDWMIEETKFVNQ